MKWSTLHSSHTVTFMRNGWAAMGSKVATGPGVMLRVPVGTCGCRFRDEGRGPGIFCMYYMYLFTRDPQ